MNLKACPSCGAERAKPDAKFCAKCGAAFKDNTPTTPRLEDEASQLGTNAVEEVTQLVNKVLPSSDNKDHFCVNCGVKLTRANRKDNTKMCYRCWVAHTPPEQCEICGNLLPLSDKPHAAKLCNKCAGQKMWQEIKQVAHDAKQAADEAKSEQIHVDTFSSRKKYKRWVSSHRDIEIIDTTAQNRWSLLWGFWRPNTTMTVT